MFGLASILGSPVVNRLLQPGGAQQGGGNMLANPQADPWTGLRSAPAYTGPLSPHGGIPDGVDRNNPPATKAAMMGHHDTPAEAQERESKGGLGGFFTPQRRAVLGDMFAGWAQGGTPQESLAYGARMVSAGRDKRRGEAERTGNVAWLMREGGYDETAARALAGNGQALTAAIRDIQSRRQPEYGFSEIGGNLVRYDKRGSDAPQVVYDGPDARPMTAAERGQWGIPADDNRPYYMDNGKPHALGGGGVNVNVGSERGFDKTIGEGYGKRFMELQDGAQTAGRALNALTVMEQAMQQPGFYSGAAGDTVASLKRYGSALGLDPNGISSMETFNAMSKQAALDTMGGSLGTGFSNADRDFVLQQVPNLSNTPEGNRQLIQVQRRLNERRQQVAQLSREYASRNEGRIDAGFDDFLARWAEQNPLFPDQPRGSGATRGAGGANGRQRARNPQTGETLEWDGSKWTPVQ